MNSIQCRMQSWIFKAAILISVPFIFSACNHVSSGSSNKYADRSCAGNPFLMKFGCSLERVQTAAERGNADAEYALGYMYYYGIGAVQDRQTAMKWIQRSAAQGQPLARRALGLLASGSSFHHVRGSGGGNSSGGGSGRGGDSDSIHQPHEDVSALNNRKPDQSIDKQLPSYGKAKNQPVLDVLQRKTPPNVTNAPSANTSNSSPKSPMDEPTSQLNKPSLKPMHLSHKERLRMQKEAREAKKATQLSQRDAVLKALEPKQPLAQKQQPRAVQNEFTAEAQEPSAQPAASVTQLSQAKETESADTDSNPITASREALTIAEQAMLHTSPKSYTVQLMGSHDLVAVKSFMRRYHLNQEQAQFYSANYHGKAWYMLIYGDYASVAQADQAIKNLPQPIRELSPWVKSFNIVQKEIELRQIVS